jgi:hypothetical protein
LITYTSITLSIFFAQADTSRVVFAWNNDDPANDDPDAVVYHGENRGSSNLNLLSGVTNPPMNEDPVESFTLAVDDVRAHKFSCMHAGFLPPFLPPSPPLSLSPFLSSCSYPNSNIIIIVQLVYTTMVALSIRN